MTKTSLAEIALIVRATSKSKDEADKAIEQFTRLDNTANLIFDKLFNRQTTESQHANRH